jgi:uncharacterized membrane protein YqiK
MLKMIFSLPATTESSSNLALIVGVVAAAVVVVIAIVFGVVLYKKTYSKGTTHK